jgi:hypothetical protein
VPRLLAKIQNDNQITHYFLSEENNVRRARHSPSTIGFGLHERQDKGCIFCRYALKISQPNVCVLRGAALQLLAVFRQLPSATAP